jgi:hypothetical protein
MRKKRKPIPKGSALPVLLTKRDVSNIRNHTFAHPDFLRAGIVERNGSLRFNWSLEDIEEIQASFAGVSSTFTRSYSAFLIITRNGKILRRCEPRLSCAVVELEVSSSSAF